METKEYRFKSINITREQFLGLSWLAYYKRLKSGDIAKSNVGMQYRRGLMLSAHTFCETVLNIDPSLMYAIEMDNNCFGLQNMNYMETVVIWEN